VFINNTTSLNCQKKPQLLLRLLQYCGLDRENDLLVSHTGMQQLVNLLTSKHPFFTTIVKAF